MPCEKRCPVILMPLAGLLLLLVSCQILQQTAPWEIPNMSIKELKARLDDPDLTIIDVRAYGDWQSSDKKIKGAVYENPKFPERWAKKYSKDKPIVLYCA